MRRKLLAIAVGAVVLSVSACGGKTENGNGAAASGAATVTEKEEKSGLFGAKESEEKQVFSQVDLKNFGSVGNDPNNLYVVNNVWGMGFDEEHMYFSADHGFFMVDYSGEQVTMLNGDIASTINRHGDYVYYVDYVGNGCRCNLKTGETECFLEKEASKDLNRSGKEYKAYHKVDNFFIVDDYLFYTDLAGWHGTSEGGTVAVYAIDLTDMSEYLVLKDGSTGRYTTDGTYVYSVYGSVRRLKLDEIKNGGMFEEVTMIKCEYENSIVFGSDGFYCADDEGHKDAYYAYKFDDLIIPDNIYGKHEEVVDLSTLSYPASEMMDHKAFILGDTFFTVQNRSPLIYYKGMDFSNPQYISQYEYLECAGCYNNKLYLVDHADGNMRLTIVDADGNYTQTALIPEVVEEEEVVVGEYNEYNTYFTTEVPPNVLPMDEIVWPENARIKRKTELNTGKEYIAWVEEDDEEGNLIKRTEGSVAGYVKYIYEWSPDQKEERVTTYNEDGTVSEYRLSTTNEEHSAYYTHITYSPDRKEIERRD